MGRKGNLANFESYFISETGEATATKLDVHERHINSNFLSWFVLSPTDSSPWSEGKVLAIEGNEDQKN